MSKILSYQASSALICHSKTLILWCSIKGPVKGFSRMLHSSSPTSCYNGEELDMKDIRPWLAGYKGGKVVLSKDDSTGIANVVLDHPSKRNAMSGAMMVELEKAVDDLEAWTLGKGLIVRGSGHMLCSGGDLDFARASAGAEGGFKMACFMHSVLGRLKALPLVSAALIHGQGALGGGAEIATACDWRLITNDCRGVGFVHSRMGIVPAWGASTRLANIVGSRLALDLICTGKIVAPNEALKIGLVDAVVSPGVSGDGLEEASAWLLERTQAELQVVRTAKVTLVQYEKQLGLDQVLERERRLFAPLWGGPANQQALSRHIKHIK